VLNDETDDGVRSLKMRIVSPRKAPWVSVFLTSNTRVRGTVINGKRVVGDLVAAPLPANICWGFRHVGLPEEGIEWILEIEPSSAPIEITVVDQSFELPALPNPDSKQLPGEIMAARSWIANSTLVRAAFSFSFLKQNQKN
jgi:hypothetical protein